MQQTAPRLTKVRRFGLPGLYAVAICAIAFLSMECGTKAASSVVAWGYGDSGQTNVPTGLSNSVAIAAGYNHSLALRADGTVIGWGDNYYGQTAVPSGLSNAVAVAAGGSQSLALLADGTLAGWGYYGEAYLPTGISNVAVIACGAGHNLALLRNGTVLSWGSNDDGQTNIPVGLSSVTDIAGGYGHSVAVLANGKVVGWGSNADGRSSPPVSISNVVAIAAGNTHNVALRADGTVAAWGDNSYGQTSIPVGLSNVVAVSAGYGYSIALRADSTAVSWGATGLPQLSVPAGLSNLVAVAGGQSHSLGLVGDGAPFLLKQLTDRTVPRGATAYLHATSSGARPMAYQWRSNGTNIAGATNVTLILTSLQPAHAGLYSVRVTNALGAVSSAQAQLSVPPLVINSQPQSQATFAGSSVSFGVALEGSGPFTYQWQFGGTNLPGATNATLLLNKVQLGQTGFYSVVVSNAFGTISSQPARLEVGLVAAWGDNRFGQTNLTAGVSNAAGVAAGTYFSLGLKSDGTVIGWGDGAAGQTNVPASLNSVTAIASGANHGLALRADATVTAWGWNDYGQTNVPVGLSDVIAIVGGWYYSTALKADGTVSVWGGSYYDERNVPVGLGNVVAIAAGGRHGLALRGDGTVTPWGDSSLGQTNIPPGISNAVAVAGGWNHSLVLRADGTVVAWGYNYSGQTNVPVGLSNVVAIAGGGNHSVALRKDGSIVAWGDNSSGQTNVPSVLTNVAAIAAGGYHTLALIGNGPPHLLASPAPRTVLVGQKAYFYAAAAGSGPLSYQWRFNGTNISGATNALLILSSVQLAQAGIYLLVISNAQGSVTNYAQMNVLPLQISSQPTNQSVYAGTTVAFDIGLRGTGPFNYQWQFNGSNLSGATGSTLVLQKAYPADMGAYSVRVGNAFGQLTSSAAILDVNVIGAWGENYYGEAAVPGGVTNIVAVAAGEGFNLALRANGTIYGWGSSGSIMPAGLSNVTAIAGGGYLGVALREDQTVVSWNNGYYQTDVPVDLSNVVAITAGDAHELALRADGTVIGWGYNGSGQVASVQDAVGIAAGNNHSLALRADGTVVGWGSGAANIPDGLSDVIAIAAGGDHSLALRADGSIIGWGDSPYGNRNYPEGVSNIVAVGEQNYYSQGLRADGAVLSWGYYYSPHLITVFPSNVVQFASGGGHLIALFGNGPPYLLNGLADRTGPVGSKVYFYARASGEQPMSYQWRFQGANLPGATNALLTLSDLQSSQAGFYSLHVSNCWGEATSRAAQLYVPPLVIASQPFSQVVLVGNTVNFSVAAKQSSPFSYQWQFNGTILPGATNSNLVLTNVQFARAGIYLVEVSNQFGEVLSEPASLEVRTVAAWGDSFYGQTAVPLGLTNTVAIAGSGYHSLALLDDGTAKAWGSYYGYSQSKPALVPPGISNLIAISSGNDHDLGLHADGSVVAWGDNWSGQTNVPAGLSSVSAIAGGYFHSVALVSNGTVVAWGENTQGQTNLPAGLSNVVAIAAGGYHNLALRADGTVTAWGQYNYGQTAVPDGLSNVIAVAAGAYHSLALRWDGTVIGWGYNTYGQASIPATLSNVVAIAAGQHFSLALKADGTIVGWGWNLAGVTTIPPDILNAVSLACGSFHGLALVGNGPPRVLTTLVNRTVLAGRDAYFYIAAVGAGPLSYQWRFNGTNIAGATNATLRLSGLRIEQAGVYSVQVSNAQSVVVSSGAELKVPPLLITTQPQSGQKYLGGTVTVNVGIEGTGPFAYQWAFNGTNLPGATGPALLINNLQLEQGGSYSVSVSNSFGKLTSASAYLDVGVVAAWGGNWSSQTSIPLGLSNVVAVGAGTFHTLALKRDGTVVGWGDNSSGQLDIPPGLSNIVAVAGRGGHSLALRGDGSVSSWGSLSQPAQVSALTDVVSIATRSDYDLGLRADGTLLAWGSSTIQPTGFSNLVSLAGGYLHSLAVRADGTVLGWGDNSYGQSDPPADLTNAVAAAGGTEHSLALCADGTVVAWGRNIFGEGSVPPGLSNVVAIAAGSYFNLALRANGQVLGWGQNFSGETTVPEDLFELVAIGAGDSHSVALVGNGAPFLVEKLADRQVPAGGRIFFHAVASGALPIHYQWRRDGTNLSGATGPTLALTSIQPSDVGMYSVIATNAFGQISAQAQLRVPALWITNQPQSQTQYAGGNVSFSVGAELSGPFSYQWLFNGTNLPAETNSTLLLTNVQAKQAGSYSVVVSNPWGQVTSADAQLTTPAIIISSQPQPRTSYSGGLVTFGVGVQGTGPFSYQWQFNGSDLPGATASSLQFVNIQPTQAGFYSVIVTNAFGTVTSETALLTVKPVAEWGGYYRPLAPLSLSNVVAVGIGYNHSLALRNDGTVVAWGGPNTYGQTNVPIGLTNTVAIACGLYHSLALGANGTVIAWGKNDSGQTNVPSALSNVVAIAAGDSHSLALRVDGTVIAWGSQESRQSTVPAGLSNVVAIAGGGGHSLALKADGKIVTWGSTAYGLTNIPTSASNVVAIAAGEWNSVALRADGKVIAWGYSSYGLTNVPATLSNVVAIAAGTYHILALRSDGIVTGWGYNSSGQLSIPTGLTNVVAIAAGRDRSMALGGSGSPFLLTGLTTRWAPGLGMSFFRAAASGANPLSYQWQFNGTNLPSASDAVLMLSSEVPSQSGLYSINVANAYGSVQSASARLNVGPVASWGMYNTGPSNAAAVAPLGLSNIVAMAAGEDHAVALRDDGTVAAWGNNLYGQGTIPNGVTNIIAIAAGRFHSLALTGSGTVIGWGHNLYGQATAPSALSNAVAIAAGQYHSLALRGDGTMEAWGDNSAGQGSVPGGISDVVAIAAGANHNLALRSDGTVAAWGALYLTAVPPGLSNVVAIEAGDTHSLALRADGKVVAWGQGPQINVPSNLSNVVAIAAGGTHSLVLVADGTVMAWGSNSYGQTNVPTGLSNGAGVPPANVIAISAGGKSSMALLGAGQPFVAAQPFQLKSAPGGQLQLRVFAVGVGPLAYQWQRDGVNLTGATNSVLSLDGTASSGTYRVVVSNALGSTISAASQVTAIPAFDLRGIMGPAADGFHLRLGGLSGRKHVIIYASTNLNGWQPIQTNPPVVGVLNFVDRTATNFARRFYRAAEIDLGLGPLRIVTATLTPPTTNGAFRLQIAGATGLGWLVLQSSTNLLGWENIATHEPVIGGWEYLHVPAAPTPERFYRVIEQR